MTKIQVHFNIWPFYQIPTKNLLSSDEVHYAAIELGLFGAKERVSRGVGGMFVPMDPLPKFLKNLPILVPKT